MKMLRMIGLVSLSLAGWGAWGQQTRPANGLQAGLKAGLKGEYFNGPNFEQKVLTRIDPAVDFDWNWQPPGPGVQREYFSVRWTGKLYAPGPGKYRFSAVADDGVRVWVNNRKVIDEWRKQDDSRFVGEITLNGRQLYDLRIEYYNDWKGSVISVSWELPEEKRFFGSRAMPREVLPARYLFTNVARPRPTIPTLTKRNPVTARLPVVPAVAKQSVPELAKLGARAGKSGTISDKRKALSGSLVSAEPIRKPKATLAAFRSTPATPATTAIESFAYLRPGEATVLPHVWFEQSSYVLLPESSAELANVVRAMNTHPHWHIDIVGHTDNVGDARLNLALSENRAKVVAAYLKRQGIADERITATGFGGTRPIADNTIESERPKNRRVEITIR